MQCATGAGGQSALQKNKVVCNMSYHSLWRDRSAASPSIDILLAASVSASGRCRQPRWPFVTPVHPVPVPALVVLLRDGVELLRISNETTTLHHYSCTRMAVDCLPLDTVRRQTRHVGLPSVRGKIQKRGRWRKNLAHNSNYDVAKTLEILLHL
eukprot:COSAG01_NODE_8086_length_2925_cov_12.218684_4_plen_154_part_00